MDRIQALEMFVAVAEAESFAGGARKLGLSAPSATRGINDLEQRLGARLFTRTTRHIRLTDAGATYLEDARTILALLRSADDAASGAATKPSGLLRITSPVEFGRIYVAPVLMDFLDAFPDMTAELLTVDRVVNLYEEGIDIGVRIGPLPSSGLSAVKVGHVRKVVCGSPAYFARHGTPQSPQELHHHTIVSPTPMTPTTEWIFGTTKSQVVKIKPRLVVTSMAGAIAVARSGWGLSRVLSYQIGPDLEQGRLTTVLDEFEPEKLPVHLVYAEGRRAAAKVRSFVDFAKTRLRRLPIFNDPTPTPSDKRF